MEKGSHNHGLLSNHEYMLLFDFLLPEGDGSGPVEMFSVCFDTDVAVHAHFYMTNDKGGEIFPGGVSSCMLYFGAICC